MRTKSPDRMEQILKFVEDRILADGISPSTAEIGEAIGTAKSTVYRYLTEMRDRGLLDYDGETISTPVTRKRSRVYSTLLRMDSSVSCGSPDYSEEHIVGRDRLPASIFGEGTFYLLTAHGDSMEDAGIFEGDLLVIRAETEPHIGDIIMALNEDNETTLKRYEGIDRNSHCAVLAYMNEAKYPGKRIEVRQLICQGVLSHTIRAY